LAQLRPPRPVGEQVTSGKDETSPDANSQLL
ncbi:cointegrate resolution protein T, partial [Xanthomonas perforans]